MTHASAINQQMLSIFKGVTLFLFITLGIFFFSQNCLAQQAEPISYQPQVSHLIPVPEITNIKQNSITSEFKPYLQGKVLNFHKVEVYLDHKFVGQAQVKEGPNGWSGFDYKFDKNIDLGKHVIYTVAENIDKIRSEKSDPINFSVEHAFPSPTLFQSKNGQNELKGVAWSNSILKVFVDEQLEDQIELGEHSSGVVGFNHKIVKSLQPGYHVIWVVAEDKISHKISKESNQIIIYTPGNKLANIKQEISSPQTKVPSPTIISPSRGQVIDNPKPHIGGLVKNDHLVKVFVDNQEDSSLVPIAHESGTASFSQSISQELDYGLHSVYTQAVSLNGHMSGQSNIVKFIVTPELYHQKAAEIKPVIPVKPQSLPIEPEQPEEITNKEPRIDEGISIVELPDEGEVKIINETIEPGEGQVGVVDGKEGGEVKIEDKTEAEDIEQITEVEDKDASVVDITPPQKIEEEEATPSESESKKEDWINIGFIVIGIILVILIIWWVILERKEMKEEEGKQKQDEGHQVEVKGEDKPPTQPDQLQIDSQPDKNGNKSDSNNQNPPVS